MSKKDKASTLDFGFNILTFEQHKDITVSTADQKKINVRDVDKIFKYLLENKDEGKFIYEKMSKFEDVKS
jgi:hypothetical protein